MWRPTYTTGRDAFWFVRNSACMRGCWSINNIDGWGEKVRGVVFKLDFAERESIRWKELFSPLFVPYPSITARNGSGPNACLGMERGLERENEWKRCGGAKLRRIIAWWEGCHITWSLSLIDSFIRTNSRCESRGVYVHLTHLMQQHNCYRQYTLGEFTYKWTRLRTVWYFQC